MGTAAFILAIGLLVGTGFGFSLAKITQYDATRDQPLDGCLRNQREIA